MGIWQNPPQPSKAPYIQEGLPVDMDAVLRQVVKYVNELAQVATVMKNDLEYMINGHLDANNIRANSIETKNLKAGAVTAEKISVDELSAISANLGHITAGLIEAVQIFGSYIATSSGYPRCEISSANNLLGAYQSPGNAARVIPTYGPGTPAILFDEAGATDGTIQKGNGALSIATLGPTRLSLQSSDEFRISSLGTLRIDGIATFTGTFSYVKFVDFTTSSVVMGSISVRKGLITSVV